MEPREIRVPFPLDMMGDLDTTLRYAEDKYLKGIDASGQQEGFHPLAAAIHAIRTAIQAYRSRAAEDAVSLDHISLERSHLATLMDFAPDDVGAGDAHRAAGHVSEWLDRDI